MGNAAAVDIKVAAANNITREREVIAGGLPEGVEGTVVRYLIRISTEGLTSCR